MILKVSKVYTDCPGGRYESQGPYSGERFRDEFLIPSYEISIENKEKLIVDLDGGYGYGCGFIEETFGGMIRKGYTPKEVFKHMEFISEDELGLIDDIKKYMLDAEKNKKQNQKRKRWFS
ncbi:MAG: STAS-like domain-containing protein [Bacilli bacterium]|nr:STAS-like domain-containing protein [Bacilli bacterium]